MEKLKHTKGPFTVQKLNHAEGDLWLQIGFFDPDDRSREIGPVAELKHLITDDDEQRANAELLALAPTAPHVCADPECPGDINRRKLEEYESLHDEMADLLESYIAEWHGDASNFYRKEPNSLKCARALLKRT